MMRIALAVLMTVVFSGCGYTFQGSGSVLPQDVKKIYIPIAENSSTESGLSSILTESLRDQFERFGVLTVVDSLVEADAVLTSRVLSVKRNTRTTNDTDTALQYDTTLNLYADLKRVNGTLLWRNPSLLISKAYGTSTDVVLTGSAEFAEGNLSSSDLGGLDSREVARGQEGQSLQSLSDQAARMIYDQAVAPDF